MPIEQAGRTIIVLAWVLTLAGVVALMVVVQPQSAPATFCADAQTRDKMRGIMFEALDQALRDHIRHAFEVWMRDSREQPERARRGVQQGAVAYIQSRDALKQWDPPPC